MRHVGKVRMGDTIEAPRADGSTATFKVRDGHRTVNIILYADLAP